MPFHLTVSYRRGSRLFTSNDGYYYVLKQKNNIKTHYVCYYKNCYARVWVLRGEDVERKNDAFPGHNHEPEPLLETEFLLRERILSRVEKESFPLKKIFDEECNKVPIDVAKKLSFKEMESTLQKVRKKCYPALPISADDFDAILTSEEWQGRFGSCINGSQFYRENIKVEGSNNLIFISDNAKDLLATSTEFHIDGTSKTIPSIPGIRHLFVMMAIKYDHAFPTCFVLMDDKKYASYREIFKLVKKLVPGINPSTIVSDFESGLLRASREEFPDAVITGCWWHFTNRIHKKVRSLQLLPVVRREQSVKTAMHMCMALPLLPADNIESGLLAVRDYANQAGFADTHLNALNNLFAYIQDQWIKKVGVDRMTVSDLPRGTNNDSEIVQMCLRKEMGHTQPNAWRFVNGLKNIENQTLTNLQRASNGLSLGRNKKRRYLAKSSVVKRALASLLINRMTIKECLVAIASVIGRKVCLPEDDDVDDNEDELDRPPSTTPVHEQQHIDKVIDPVHVYEGPNLHEYGVKMEEVHISSISNCSPQEFVDEKIEEFYFVFDPAHVYEGPNLDEYRLKRVEVNLSSISTCPPQEFVEQQIKELTADLAERESEEDVQSNSEHRVCCHCLTNKPTWVVVPCGHWAGCTTCCITQINTPFYFSSTSDLEIENIRLPIHCTQCKGLVGKLMKVS